MVRIVQQYGFEAAHRVLGPRGADERNGRGSQLHGHSYTLEVELEGDPDIYGRLIDPVELDRRVGRWFRAHWDYVTFLAEDDPLAGALRGHAQRVVRTSAPPTDEVLAQLAYLIVRRLVADLNVRLVSTAVGPHGLSASYARASNVSTDSGLYAIAYPTTLEEDAVPLVPHSPATAPVAPTVLPTLGLTIDELQIRIDLDDLA